MNKRTYVLVGRGKGCAMTPIIYLVFCAQRSGTLAFLSVCLTDTRCC